MAYCGELQGTLPSMPLRYIYERFNNFTKTLGINGTVWIGGHDRIEEGLVEWQDESPDGESASITDNNNSTNNCLAFNTDTEELLWEDCNSHHKFLCQWKEERSACALSKGYRFSNKCYKRLTSVDGETREQAYSLCQQWDGNATLFMPDNEIEALFIQESSNNEEEIWVDSTDEVAEGQWVWRDGKTRAFINRYHFNNLENSCSYFVVYKNQFFANPCDRTGRPPFLTLCQSASPVPQTTTTTTTAATTTTITTATTTPAAGCQIEGAPEDGLSISSTKCLKFQKSSAIVLAEETFGAGIKLCGEQRGQLVQFKNMTEFTQFKSLFIGNGILSDRVWVGASDAFEEGILKWQDGTVGTAIEVGTNSSNDLATNCIVYDSATQKLEWDNCRTEHNIVCQWTPDQGSCTMKEGFVYGDKCSRHFNTPASSFDEAVSICQTWDVNATLYMPDDMVEKEFWRKTLRSYDKVWLDIKRDVETGIWSWKDGLSRVVGSIVSGNDTFECAHYFPHLGYFKANPCAPIMGNGFQVLCQVSEEPTILTTTTTTTMISTTTTATTTTESETTTTTSDATTTIPLQTTSAALLITSTTNPTTTATTLPTATTVEAAIATTVPAMATTTIKTTNTLDEDSTTVTPTIPTEICHIQNSPGGFFKFGTKCIKIEENTLTPNHIEGLSYCAEKYGSELLTLNSKDQFEEILKHVGFEDGYFLTSGSDRTQDRVVQWQDGSQGSPVDYIHGSREGNDKNCVRINPKAKRLEWHKCYPQENRVICQVRETMSNCTAKHGFQFKNKCYRQKAEEISASSEAENLCTDWHSSTLFMPDNEEEISFIGDFLKGRKAWLGANDLAEEGVVVWTDGRARNFITFENNKQENDCTRFQKNGGNFFRFVKCTEAQYKRAVICQIGSDELVSDWSDWSECPVKCVRSKMTRTRSCYDSSQHNQEQGLCGDLLLVEEKECLVREDCQGSGYYLAEVQQSCDEFCASKDLGCSTEVETGNSANAFADVLLPYTIDSTRSEWQKTYSPGCFVGDVCVEFEGVPNEVKCDQTPEENNFRRFCHCINATDLGFSNWSPWTECTATCNGSRLRDRVCYERCSGEEREMESCGAPHCPIHGGLSEWGSWSNCDVTCGGGSTRRMRACNSPVPQYDGNDCVGSLEDLISCGVGNCPVDATWAGWSVWSSCDKPCNTGHYVRRRTCIPANYGGVPCSEIPGSSQDRQPCNTMPCEESYANLVLHIEADFTEGMTNPNDPEYKIFESNLQAQVTSIYEDGGDVMEGQVLNVVCHSLEPGSVVANFTINYASMEMEQFLFFQDVIETSQALGKLDLVAGENISLSIGPDLLSEPPSNVSAFSPSPEVLSISWNALNQSNVDNYIIFYREKLLSNQPYSTYATENTTAHLTWLKPGTEYVYRVLAYSTAKGNGVASTLASIWTMEKRPNVAPENITAEASGPFNVYVTWISVPQEEMNGLALGYRIYVFTNGAYVSNETAPFDYSGWAYTSNLEPSTSYVFEVCAFNSAGDGPCDKASARTLDSAPTAAPQNIYISSIKTHTQLTMHWSPPPADQIHGDLLSYKIKVFPIKSGADVYINPKVDVYDLHPSLNSLTLKFLDSNTFYNFEIMAVNQFGEGVSDQVVGRTCLCPPVVSSNFYLLAPYLTKDVDDQLSGVFGEILNTVVQATCGVCKTPNGPVSTKLDIIRNGRGAFAQKATELKILKEVDEFTDLSFPIIGNTHSDEMVGYPFVPLVGHPGVVAIVRDKNINEIVVEMIMMILGIYPLIGLNFLMMLAAGFIVWLLEACNNTNGNIDFQTSWIRGVYEGWYWAFVTQGTHGYGDFTVTKFYSRCFAVVWALVGLVMTSLIIGAIVTALTTVNGAAQFKIYGSEVGALNGSFEEKLGLLRNGKVNEKRAYTTVQALREDLLAGKIEGVLLDAYTAGANAHLFTDERLRAATKLEYPRSYGFVLSGGLKSVATEFKSYIRTEEDWILGILKNSTEPMGVSPPAELKSPFDPESSILSTALVSMTIMILVFSIFGLIWSHYLKKLNQKNTQRLSNKDLFNQCNDMVNDFESSMNTKILELEDKHSLQRELLIKDYYGHSAIDHHARHGDRLQRMLNNKLQRNAIRPVLPNKEDQLDQQGDIETGEKIQFQTPREFKESQELFEETPVDAFENDGGEDTTEHSDNINSIEQSDDINSTEQSDDINSLEQSDDINSLEQSDDINSLEQSGDNSAPSVV
uniref:Uncharacterized protein n=2 Tax=Clytia hemisphaerica TaxID=252671 RepID=A0A7M5X8J7_9CNID